jgi:hypothetical protein
MVTVPPSWRPAPATGLTQPFAGTARGGGPASFLAPAFSLDRLSLALNDAAVPVIAVVIGDTKRRTFWSFVHAFTTEVNPFSQIIFPARPGLPSCPATEPSDDPRDGPPIADVEARGFDAIDLVRHNPGQRRYIGENLFRCHGGRRDDVRSLRRRRLVGLGLIVLAVAFGFRLTQLAWAPMHLLVPLYDDPGRSWVKVARLLPPGSDVIVNPASGPGQRPRASYALGVLALEGQGIGVLGYVSTGYGHVPRAKVLKDIHRYQSWYHVNGIFLDSTPAACSARTLAYYANLVQAVRAGAPAAPVVMNPGTPPGACWNRLGATLVVEENTLGAISRPLPGWLRRVPSPRMAIILYRVAPSYLATALARVRLAGAGYVFVTSRGGEWHPNAYGGLPSYFRQEVRLVRSESPWHWQRAWAVLP